MRWDNLFDDLESQLEQELRAGEVDERVEAERLRIGRLSLRDRIVAVVEGHSRRDEYSLRFTLVSGDLVRVRPLAIGKDWLSGDVRDGSSSGAQCILPFAAIAGVGLDRAEVEPSLAAEDSRRASLTAKLGIAFVLRDLARRRASLEVVTAAGPVTGTIDRVGRDHLDIAVHERGEARRRSAVAESRLIPLERILLVRL